MRVSAPRSRSRPLRPLIIDPEAKRKAARVIEYAEQHHFHPGVDPAPGDNPQFVCHLNTYRVVFTFTLDPEGGKVWRHMSVSIPDARLYANPFAVLTIAQDLFGFTGWDHRTVEPLPEGWVFDLSEDDHCIAVAQVRE